MLPVWILLLLSFFLSIVVSNQNLSTARTVYGLSDMHVVSLKVPELNWKKKGRQPGR